MSDKVIKLIKEVEEDFNKFINFALSAKNKNIEKYYGIDGERFENLFLHWKTCTKKLSPFRDDYYLTPEKINNEATKKKQDVKDNGKGALQKSPPRIRSLLKEYYGSDNDSSYQPNQKFEIGLESKGKKGMYRFRVMVDGKDSVLLISDIKNSNKPPQNTIPNDQPPHSDYDYMAKQLSEAERLLNDSKKILQAIRKYQSLILDSDEFHSDIITSIVHQIRIRSEYKGEISSVYSKLADIEQPPHGARKVVESLFKLLAKNYKNFTFAFTGSLYFGRLDLRRIYFSTKSSNPYENTLRYANFNGCNIGWTAFNGMDLTGTNFANINCARAAMFSKRTKLNDVNFYNADLRHINHDPASGKLITENYDPCIFLDVKTMYMAKLDNDLAKYLMERKPSLFEPCENPKRAKLSNNVPF